MTARAGGWTPTDRLLFGYSTFTGLLALLWGWRLGAGLWIGIVLGHLLVAALILWMHRIPLRGFSWAGLARDGYPIAVILFLYWELRHLALLFSNGYHDPTVIAWEAALFGEQLAMTLSQRIPGSPLSEYLHLSYAFYWALLPVVGATLYARRKVEGFRALLFTVLLVFFACYLVFIFWPVEGPYYRFELLGPPLSGGVFRRFVLTVLERGASRGAAFPSSHVAVAVAALCVAHRWERPLFWAILPLVVGLVVGTVYGRFHYAIDAAAGVATGLLGFLSAPRVRTLLGSGPPADAFSGQRIGAAEASKE